MSVYAPSIVVRSTERGAIVLLPSWSYREFCDMDTKLLFSNQAFIEAIYHLRRQA